MQTLLFYISRLTHPDCQYNYYVDKRSVTDQVSVIVEAMPHASQQRKEHILETHLKPDQMGKTL